MTTSNLIETLEWSLILGNSTHESSQNSTEILISKILDGQYRESLTCDITKQILGTELSAEDDFVKNFTGNLDINVYISNRIKKYISSSLHELESQQNQLLKQLNLLCVAVACLNAFIQTSWTGPNLDLEPRDILPTIIRDKYNSDELNKKALESLSTDGEEAYHLVPRALYLLISRIILVDNEQLFTDLKTSLWWGQRVLFLQQRILDNVAGSLHDLMLQYLKTFESKLISTNSDIYARYHIEFGLVYHYYGQDSLAFQHFLNAQKSSQLQWKVTGALGKRTKFQTSDISQLLVVAKSKEEFPDESDSRKKLPDNLRLNDDTLLEKIEFSNQNDDVVDFDLQNQKNLKIIDQCLLLAFCLNVKNTNPSHGITTELMVPYVSRVLENPNNWMVYTMALLLRSRLEKEKSRTVERSALQLQALVDQFPLELSSAKERMAYFYQILLPSKWDMEKELAVQYLSIGVVRSALQIFERLEMWEDVINCYIMLEKEVEAKKIIHEQLKITPNSPKLYCLLGDVEKDPKHWEHAWEISGNRFARAMRSLGGYWYKREEYRKSIECYANALQINPLFENSWFVQGCAAMHVKEWETAIQAFSRTIAIDPENSEAWNNLASIFLKQKRKPDAYNSLQQGLRLNYDSWKIWTNYLYTAIDIGEFAEAIRAMQRVVDLRWEKEKDSCVDLQVLELLVNAVTQGIQDARQNSASQLAPRLEKLLTETITSRITSNQHIWRLCAKFWFWKKEYDEALEAYLKAYRSVLRDPNLGNSYDVFEKVANAALEVVEAYQNFGEKKVLRKIDSNDDGLEIEKIVCKDWKYQAKSLLKSLIGRTKNSFEGTPMHDKLKEVANELSE
ncbi:12569_t:CDS:1 [Funneliformis mosseae]|uniref:12569_t:CDS:1 n=1 Tax=Funneliformis mosseae TaxID=27381 RepID=A0A9N9B4I5_FUNMO|nr:12569_t:CDS:1 [Funneliformis mosseae]